MRIPTGAGTNHNRTARSQRNSNLEKNPGGVLLRPDFVCGLTLIPPIHSGRSSAKILGRKIRGREPDSLPRQTAATFLALADLLR